MSAAVAEVKAPEPFSHRPRPWVFLAGSIEKGLADRWQARVGEALASSGATILNPRRDDWDGSWREALEDARFREQVEWELDAQDRSDLTLIYFAPGTRSPVTLLELGLHARSGRLIVCCPEGFWRKGNVDAVCRRYGTRQVATIEELVASAQDWLRPR